MNKLWLCFLGLLGLDQISKAWILNSGLGTWFPANVEISIFLKKVTSFFNIVLTKNTGVSFSFFNGLSSQLPLIVLTLFIIIWLVRWLRKESLHYHRLAVVFILAGAIGNLIDRVRFGGVIDFLDVHYGGWHWPAFNLADTWISIGAGIYLLSFLLKSRKKEA